MLLTVVLMDIGKGDNDIDLKYILKGEVMTRKTAKIFQNGRSQAIRLPKEFRFEGKEVYIDKEGDKVILSPKPTSWRDFFEQTPLPSPDFMAERQDLPLQEREDIF
jgi:antitoxin VapB